MGSVAGKSAPGNFEDPTQITANDARENKVLSYIESQCIESSMITKDLVAASSRPLVLSILSDGESYGYAIIQRVREMSDGQMQWTDGMLYPVLHRLEREGLIVSEWKKADTGRRRKYYRVNASGKKALNEERKQWALVNKTLNKLWNEPSPCLI